MRVAVLGTGAAGRAIASRLLELGHTVTMGSRRADGEALAEWVAKAGEDAQGGTFAEAAAASNDDSLAEQIQAAFPETRVVKSLNTVNCEVMVDPGRVRGDHAIFVCGDDDAAKAQVKALLEAIGWAPESIVDLGDLTGARATEMYVALWVRLYGTLDSADFNIAIAR
jgi:predicted dinucleotide-binding enzyme